MVATECIHRAMTTLLYPLKKKGGGLGGGSNVIIPHPNAR